MRTEIPTPICALEAAGMLRSTAANSSNPSDLTIRIIVTSLW
jgi:hypothetical protein